MNIYNIQKTDGDSYALINDETKKEGGLFMTKSEGTTLIADMAKEKQISATHTLDLFRKIHNLDIPCWPGVPKGSFEEAVYDGCKHIIERKLEEKAYMEQYDGKPTLIICDSCGKHGKIWAEKFETENFISREEAYELVNILLEKEKISVSEKQDLEEQIAASSLTEKASDAFEIILFGSLFVTEEGK